MSTKTLISVVIPTYNRADMLHERFGELTRQTHQNFQLIIIDDGSTDNTHDVVDDWLSSGFFDNFTYITLRQNSRNVTIPRNIGLSYADGDYICHMDDDVPINDNKFEVLAKALDDNPSAMLAYGYRLHRSGPNSVSIVGPANFNPLKGWGMDSSQFMYRKSVYDKIDPVFCKRACDWELMKVIWTAFPESFVEIRNVVSEYIWHGGNRSLDDSTKVRDIDVKPFLAYFKDDFWMPKEATV